QKKAIIFTDSRQDTALQAEHLNEFQRRVKFRQYFYHALKYFEDHGDIVSDDVIGKKLYDFLEMENMLPNFERRETDIQFSQRTPSIREFKEFLTFLVLSDIQQSRYFLDVNLEKLGLLQIEYDGLDLLSNDSIIEKIKQLFNKTKEERYDYLRGILDIFRWNGAIANRAFIDKASKWDEWKKKLNEEILFDINRSRYERVGFAFELPQTTRRIYDKQDKVVFKSILGSNSILVNWTKKFFNINDTERARLILKQTIELLDTTGFLEAFWTKRKTFKLYQIKEGKLIFKLNTQDSFLKCPKCRRTYFFKHFRSCAWRTCPSLEVVPVEREHYYLKLYKNLPEKESEIHAKEHSAQLEGVERERFELDFQKTSIGAINVLVCTPTMELGIDIGELSAIIMRNVPPDPSRYAQRAGRAGRKNQPSIVEVFCGAGIAKGPHDQYFYKMPELIVSGKINPPNFLLDNKKLITKHLHSVIIETLQLKIPQKIGEILDLEKLGEQDNVILPLRNHLKLNLIKNINTNFSILQNTIKKIFEQEIETFPWFNDEFIQNILKKFNTNLDVIFDPFRETYLETYRELKSLNNKSLRERLTDKEKNEQHILQKKLNDMREGKQQYNTFGYLKTYGFLPNYGFPSDNRLLTMFDYDTQKYHENWRSSVIAIKEFAPFNRVYFLGNKYQVNKAYLMKTISEQKTPETIKIYICNNCLEIMIGRLNSTLVKCPYCNEEINLNNSISAIEFPHIFSMTSARITCDEENRQAIGYDIIMNYKRMDSKVKEFSLVKNGVEMGTISYEHNGNIYMVNKGRRMKSRNTNEIKLQKFNYCTACGDWLSEENRETHVDECPKRGTADNIKRDLWLFIEGNHDVMVFKFPPKINDPQQGISYYTTLKETIIQSLMLTYNLDDSELIGFLRPLPGTTEQEIVLFETEEGGAGILQSLLDPMTIQFEKFIKNLFTVIHLSPDPPHDPLSDACISACYNCLLRFRNQMEHGFLDRRIIIPFIKELENSILIPSEEKKIDHSDLINRLKEKCDSELEKKVLDALVKLRLPLPNEAQKTYYEEDIPITTADFYYKQQNNEVYVFVDGPPH
ncbi:MAG: helicase-related protein, partial [Promethearchaeota archaeon]